METTKENIDDLIDHWHESKSSQKLHEFLGLTWEEYKRYVETDKLPDEE